ncbi:hypothetical protein CaCOL14_006874 [Colletotrichum acutatum]|uniref:FAD binding domain-containing protein n=1 Tax=Glomerella acutata TaxID=27357 RepID=A0AAD8UCZ5_GLOAC|nr:FAD binding domain-containing protein [Colletotrichum acutatum]KAK1716189.1 FAD binding domain-containing protein [Colletotrichum acutatum]
MGRKDVNCVLALLLGLGGLTAGLPPTIARPFSLSQPCRLLAESGLKDQLFFAGDVEYSKTLNTYYAGESRNMRPQCIVKPETTGQASIAIQVLNSDKVGKCWSVAIRAGGHSNFPASNTNSGVTIDLVNLNNLSIEINGTVSVGSGNRWGDVYRFLEPQGLMTSGGRENTVGVSGLLLGGGFSWFSGQVGFAADSVVEYEVVLASGNLVRASQDENFDLFKALKGGACNFGLVTKFVLETFPSRNFYGGVMVFPWAQKNAIIQTFVEMIDGNTNGHPEDTGFAAAAWSPSGGKRMSFVVANIEGQSNSTAFAGLEVLSPVVDMRANLPVTGIAAQIASKSGEYQVWSTLTFHNTLDMGREVLLSFDAVIEDIHDQVENGDDFRIVYLLTPFPTLFSSYGDNVLGLDKTHEKNSIVFSIQGILPNTKYVGLLRQRLREATADIEAYARATGQLIPYLYLNYAGQDQRPLATYGEENIRFLKRIAERYDPGQFFQYGVPGGFKIKDV